MSQIYSSFPSSIRVTSLEKKILDSFDLFEFESNYKRRRNKNVNYDLILRCECTRDQLEEFFKWYGDTLNFGVNSFTGIFEIIKDDELEEDFLYNFNKTPSYSVAEGDIMSLNIELTRTVDKCGFEYINLLSILNNIKKNLNLQNTAVEANVACPLIYQQLGAALNNIYNSLEDPYNYESSRSFY